MSKPSPTKQLMSRMDTLLSQPPFTANCQPILIGSLPLSNHREAMAMILSHTPDIPLWPQLPSHPAEGMVRQFISGLPGLIDHNNRYFVDTTAADFTSQMTFFFQNIIDAAAEQTLGQDSPFGLTDDTCRGFTELKKVAQNAPRPFWAVKGQITGPMTIGISLKDEAGNSLFYNDLYREMIIALLAVKARWQAEQLRNFPSKNPPLVFIDEPGLVSIGSAAFTTVTREMVYDGITEIINNITRGGGISGVHICATGDWGPVFTSGARIISFDAYSYFDNFMIYHDQLGQFLTAGGILAWGIVPTGNREAIERETVDSLYQTWCKQRAAIVALGFSPAQIFQQTLIAPACGTGSLSLKQARKVLKLTAGLADKIRNTC